MLANISRLSLIACNASRPSPDLSAAARMFSVLVHKFSSRCRMVSPMFSSRFSAARDTASATCDLCRESASSETRYSAIFRESDHRKQAPNQFAVSWNANKWSNAEAWLLNLRPGENNRRNNSANHNRRPSRAAAFQDGADPMFGGQAMLSGLPFDSHNVFG